jgi:CRP-like cAMP-binding protein
MIEAASCADCPARARGLFACLTRAQLDRLVSSRFAHAYSPLRAPYHEGTPSLAVFCVRAGEFKLWRSTPGGGQHVLGTRGPGDLMGYRAVLADRPYAVTADPLGPAVACTIPRDTFLDLARENSEFTFALLRRLAGDSIENEDRLVADSIANARQRTARYLMRLVRRDAAGSAPPFRLPLSFKREELAHLVGTTPETLSRTLHGFAKRGIIGFEGREILVTDLAALTRIGR